MANEEHLAILRQGVRAWNNWRNVIKVTTSSDEEHLIVVKSKGSDISESVINSSNFNEASPSYPDLSSAILINADLTNADLSYSNLNKANLSSADLRSADLRGANLRGAIFSYADLRGAGLIDTDLRDANLRSANLRGVILSETNLSGAVLCDVDLKSANLKGAILRFAIFHGADLDGVDLRGADLTGAIIQSVDFSRSHLIEANFSNADLRGAIFSKQDLSNADFNKADLRHASLQMARLINAKMDGADLTEACLWATQRAGWSIKGVICESIYWDKDAKEKTVYAPGEFERLFADKTRLRLFYKDGISALEIATLPALIQHLEETQGCSLRFVKINEDGGGAVVELAIEDTDNQSPEQVKQLQEALQKEAQEKTEAIHSALAHKETICRLEGKLELAYSFVRDLMNRPTYIVNTQGGSMGDKYEISGQAGAVGPNAHAHDMTFNQLVNNVEQSIDLAALATQLSELRQAMAAKQDASPQAVIAAGEVAKAEIAATEKNIPKVVEHLKAAGQWTLDFAKEIGKDVVVAAIKKAMGME